MRFKTKAVISVITSLSLLFCGGCKDYDNVLKELEKTDISYIMKTNLTCVNGEELYVKTPFYVPSDILIRYENPVYFDGRRLYFFRQSITEAETDAEKAESGIAVAPRTAVIAYYDTQKNEISLVLEEDNKKHISYSFAAFKDSYLYYYRLEQENAAGSPNDSTALYRISIEDKEPEMIAEIHTTNRLPKQKAAAAGDSLFFEYSGYSENTDDNIIYTAYSYNTRTKEYREFKTGIRNLMKYKDGIAYIKDNGGVYYLNLSDSSETEIYVPDDEEKISFYSNGEKIFYQLFIADEETSSAEVGYISNMKRKEIGDNIKNSGFFISMSGEDMFLMTVSGGDNIIYDEKYDCFARISLNRENHKGFPADNSVIFVCYDNGGQNPIFYLYSREKVKTLLSSSVNAPKR